MFMVRYDSDQGVGGMKMKNVSSNTCLVFEPKDIVLVVFLMESLTLI